MIHTITNTDLNCSLLNYFFLIVKIAVNQLFLVPNFEILLEKTKYFTMTVTILIDTIKINNFTVHQNGKRINLIFFIEIFRLSRDYF